MSKELGTKVKLEHNESRNNEMLHKLSSFDAVSVQLVKKKIADKEKIITRGI